MAYDGREDGACNDDCGDSDAAFFFPISNIPSSLDDNFAPLPPESDSGGGA